MIFYFITRCTIVKRAHDRGWSGKKFMIVFLVLYSLTFLQNLLGLFGVVLPDIYGTIVSIVSIATLVCFIILLFVPGKAGNNEYGKDPINTRMRFLG